MSIKFPTAYIELMCVIHEKTFSGLVEELNNKGMKISLSQFNYLKNNKLFDNAKVQDIANTMGWTSPECYVDILEVDIPLGTNVRRLLTSYILEKITELGMKKVELAEGISSKGYPLNRQTLSVYFSQGMPREAINAAFEFLGIEEPNHEKLVIDYLKSISGSEESTPIEKENYITLPVTNLRPSAGQGTDLSEEVIEMVKIKSEPMFTAFKDKVNPALPIGICTIKGDSMYPTYREGDSLVVQPCSELDRNGVYVFTVKGYLYVKRLQNIAGEWMVISDNQHYVSWKLPSEEIEILSKVVGAFLIRGA